MNHTIPSFFGIIKVSTAHSEQLTFFKHLFYTDGQLHVIKFAREYVEFGRVFHGMEKCLLLVLCHSPLLSTVLEFHQIRMHIFGARYASLLVVLE
jgi:hypothetical protein